MHSGGGGVSAGTRRNTWEWLHTWHNYIALPSLFLGLISTLLLFHSHEPPQKNDKICVAACSLVSPLCYGTPLIMVMMIIIMMIMMMVMLMGAEMWSACCYDNWFCFAVGHQKIGHKGFARGRRTLFTMNLIAWATTAPLLSSPLLSPLHFTPLYYHPSSSNLIKSLLVKEMNQRWIS